MTAERRAWLSATLVFAVLEFSLIAFADRPLSLWLRQVDADHPAVIDAFRAYTDIGKGAWYAWPSGLGTLLCFALCYARQCPERIRASLIRLGRTLAFFFVCTAGAGLLTDAIKPLVGRARPKLLASDGVFGLDPWSFKADWHSMPSGHSTTGFAVAFSLMVLFPRARWPLLAFAGMIGLSRIMVNAHFLSDVVAGAAVGWITTYAVTRFFRHRGWLSRPHAMVSARDGDHPLNNR